MTDRFAQFRNEQERLRGQIRVEPLGTLPRLIAGVDVHGGRGRPGLAVATLLDTDHNAIDESVVHRELNVPYVPGFLSFREMPICVEALQRLAYAPDLVLVDGHGSAHPRRFGLACHIGVTIDVPTIGVAKAPLVGTFEEPGVTRGDVSPVRADGKIIGMAVRSRSNVRPMFVSIGHRIQLDEAVEWTLLMTGRYRLPEPSRIAHLRARKLTAE